MGNAKSFGSDGYPEGFEPPTFDPQLGFPNGRKKRVMVASQQEMMAAQVPAYFRDYCAHMYIDYMACQRLHFPMMYKCKQQFNAYSNCEINDGILRMKEYERERRLLRRQKKKEEAMKALSV